MSVNLEFSYYEAKSVVYSRSKTLSSHSTSPLSFPYLTYKNLKILLSHCLPSPCSLEKRHFCKFKGQMTARHSCRKNSGWGRASKHKISLGSKSLSPFLSFLFFLNPKVKLDSNILPNPILFRIFQLPNIINGVNWNNHGPRNAAWHQEARRGQTFLIAGFSNFSLFFRLSLYLFLFYLFFSLYLPLSFPFPPSRSFSHPKVTADSRINFPMWTQIRGKQAGFMRNWSFRM